MEPKRTVFLDDDDVEEDKLFNDDFKSRDDAKEEVDDLHVEELPSNDDRSSFSFLFLLFANLKIVVSLR